MTYSREDDPGRVCRGATDVPPSALRIHQLEIAVVGPSKAEADAVPGLDQERSGHEVEGHLLDRSCVHRLSIGPGIAVLRHCIGIMDGANDLSAVNEP